MLFVVTNTKSLPLASGSVHWLESALTVPSTSQKHHDVHLLWCGWNSSNKEASSKPVTEVNEPSDSLSEKHSILSKAVHTPRQVSAVLVDRLCCAANFAV